MRYQQQQLRNAPLVPVDIGSANPLPGRTLPNETFVARAEHSDVHNHLGSERQYDRAGIGVVMSGLLDYQGQIGTATLVPGTVVFGNAEEHFRVHHIDTDKIQRLVVWYDHALLEEVASAYGCAVPRFQVVSLPPGKAAAFIYTRMQALARGCANPLEAAGDLAVMGLTLAADERQNVTVSRRDRKRILAVVDYIEHSFSEPCTVEMLASMSGASRFHFMRLFKTVIGLSPNQYVINARLRAAATRIIGCKAPVSEIALECGFNDISHFNTTFRAMFGCTPRQMRGMSGTA